MQLRTLKHTVHFSVEKENMKKQGDLRHGSIMWPWVTHTALLQRAPFIQYSRWIVLPRIWQDPSLSSKFLFLLSYFLSILSIKILTFLNQWDCAQRARLRTLHFTTKNKYCHISVISFVHSCPSFSHGFHIYWQLTDFARHWRIWESSSVESELCMTDNPYLMCRTTSDTTEDHEVSCWHEEKVVKRTQGLAN